MVENLAATLRELGVGDAQIGEVAAIAESVRARCGDAVASKLVVPRDSAPPSVPAELSVVLDPQKALHTRYGARSECLFLLRPDGHVGYRAQPADLGPLLAYLDGVFTPR